MIGCTSNWYAICARPRRSRRGPDRRLEGAADISADVLADDADLIHSMIAGGGASQAGSTTPGAARALTRGPRGAYLSRLREAAERAESLSCVIRKTRGSSPIAHRVPLHSVGKDRTGAGGILDDSRSAAHHRQGLRADQPVPAGGGLHAAMSAAARRNVANPRGRWRSPRCSKSTARSTVTCTRGCN